MHLDLTTPLKHLNGEPIVYQGFELTLGLALQNAVTAALPRDDQLTYGEKIELWKLGRKLGVDVRDPDPTPPVFSEGEFTLLRERVSGAYPDIPIVGAINDCLEGAAR